MALLLQASGIADHVTINGVGHQPSTSGAVTIDVTVVEESSQKSPHSGRDVVVVTRLEVAVTGGKEPLARALWTKGMARAILWADKTLRRDILAKSDGTDDQVVISEPPGKRVIAVKTMMRSTVMDRIDAGALTGLIDNIDGAIEDANAGDGTARAHVILTHGVRNIRWINLGVVLGALVQDYMFTGATIGDVIEIRDASGTLIESTTALTQPTGQQSTAATVPAGQYSITIDGVESARLLTVTEVPG